MSQDYENKYLHLLFPIFLVAWYPLLASMMLFGK